MRAQFLDQLRAGLKGLPQAQIADIVADCEAHFSDAATAGRSEAEVASSLGDPARLAKQYALAVGELRLGHIDQDRLSMRISGAGEVRGEGKVADLDVSISGFGGAELGDLAAQTARGRISGAGDAKIRPSERADINLSGIGNVKLLSQPKNLVTHISGLGQVEGPDGGDDHYN